MLSDIEIGELAMLSKVLMTTPDGCRSVGVKGLLHHHKVEVLARVQLLFFPPADSFPSLPKNRHFRLYVRLLACESLNNPQSHLSQVFNLDKILKIVSQITKAPISQNYLDTRPGATCYVVGLSLLLRLY